MAVKPFRPWPGLRHPMVQTVLASSRIRTLGKNPAAERSQDVILDADNGARLLGFYTPRPDPGPKGLVILLHGWEGSGNSVYILSSARFLFRSGFSILRLNLKDHGPSHHLNRDLFFATHIDEVFQAVAEISRRHANLPVFLAGFSLGGNFALRIARECASNPIENLLHVVAVSPVLDPDRATDAIDQNRLIQKYFLRKWRRSLVRKQRLFPDLYDFSAVLTRNSIRGMTDVILSAYSDYPDARSYFRGYSLLRDDLEHVAIATTIITSADDPVIPVRDFFELKINPSTRLTIHARGGHNGFIEGPSLRTGCDRWMAEAFNQHLHHMEE